MELQIPPSPLSIAKLHQGGVNNARKTKNRNKFMRCSVCKNEIEENYCPNCGQYFKDKRVNFRTIFIDLFDSVFSLESSFFKNIKVAVNQPKTLPTNYWNGFRKFYFSPGKFFTIASLFLLLHYSIANEFLGIVVSSNISSQFVVLLTNILLLTFSSFLLYIQFKKNLFEHLILNLYNVSLWIIIFVPISIFLSLVLDNNKIEQFFFVAFHILVIVWNSKAFELTIFKRILFVTLNLILIYGTLLFLVYKYGEF
ncbi:hypothetical protein MMU07_09265 [Aquiflexum sp. LQ15W]|uniref:hypothetical protein n=1 Tax=Cognataquiflexum nitidum TaxID=2922272 RepID=UPI001F128E4F|nr:hypothetical protein [Cognataquiflexum nitidum]MCH6199769.1 hypothetical protein [Cognataquiflexum nitidum]